MANRRRIERERAAAALRDRRAVRVLDLRDSWLELPVSLRVLRGFLGVTFLYAGLQKLADPGFLHRGSITYIGGQLEAFAQGTPAGGLLRLLDRHPVVSGIGVALGEVGIGIGTLLGVLEFWAAVGGFVISAILALSASWRVYPYFLGSDSIYAIAWLTLGLAVRERRTAVTPAGAGSHPAGAVIGRRELLRGGLVAAVVALTATLAGAIGFRRERSLAALPAPTPSPTDGASTSPSAGPSTDPGASKPHARDAITTLAALAVGDAMGFQTKDGTPGALVRLTDTEVVAYSRVCTHEGCLVQWDHADSLLVCPCHGAVFDPAKGAEPVRGPAYQPLPGIDVTVQPNGDITVV